MIEETEGNAGKTIWIWRFMLWFENAPEARMKNFQIGWYDKNREEQIWQIDITFWPPLKDGSHYA